MGKMELSLEDVINFSCDHCGISLTVDDSLAGVTGPCPSCGKSVTAPELKESDEPEKVSMRPRGGARKRDLPSSKAGKDVKVSSPSRDELVGAGKSSARGGGRFGSSHRRHSVRSDGALSEARKERAELAAVVKILVAGLLVLAIILAVAYWLNHRFNAV